METLLFLAAGAAVVLACIVVAVASARARRPELAMQREIDIAESGEDALVAALQPPSESPIERDGPIVDLKPVGDDGKGEPRWQAPQVADGRKPEP